MTQEQALQLFEQTGALLKGHFILRSGLHSREFFQCALALQEMPIVEKLGAGLADQLKDLGARTRSEERRVGKECEVVCRSRWSPSQ